MNPNPHYPLHSDILLSHYGIAVFTSKHFTSLVGDDARLEYLGFLKKLSLTVDHDGFEHVTTYNFCDGSKLRIYAGREVVWC